MTSDKTAVSISPYALYHIWFPSNLQTDTAIETGRQNGYALYGTHTAHIPAV